VNRLLKQFEQTQKMMKQFSRGGMSQLMRGLKGDDARNALSAAGRPPQRIASFLLV
jgi:signal recognition particle GTPase